jgi:anti-anti-sigma factor
MALNAIDVKSMNGRCKDVVSLLDGEPIVFNDDKYKLSLSVYRLYNDTKKRNELEKARLLELGGDFTLADTEQFKKHVLEYMIYEGVCNFVVDLKNVYMIDSRAIGCIIALAHHDKCPVKMYICNANNDINGVLTRVGFNRSELKDKISMTQTFNSAYSQLLKDYIK